MWGRLQLNVGIPQSSVTNLDSFRELLRSRPVSGWSRSFSPFVELRESKYYVCSLAIIEPLHGLLSAHSFLRSWREKLPQSFIVEGLVSFLSVFLIYLHSALMGLRGSKIKRGAKVLTTVNAAVLGNSQSGKSTFLKQLNLLHVDQGEYLYDSKIFPPCSLSLSPCILTALANRVPFRSFVRTWSWRSRKRWKKKPTN